MNKTIVPELLTSLLIDQSGVEEYYIFSSCRLCYLNNSNIKFIKKLIIYTVYIIL